MVQNSLYLLKWCPYGHGHFHRHKVNMPNLVSYLNRTPTFESGMWFDVAQRT